MTYDAEELEQYPEIMNKEQLRKVCHISKRTAHYLLQFNLIPHVCTGKMNLFFIFFICITF